MTRYLTPEEYAERSGITPALVENGRLPRADTRRCDGKDCRMTREAIINELKTDAGKRLMRELQECPHNHLGELVAEIEREAAKEAETALDIRVWQHHHGVPPALADL